MQASQAKTTAPQPKKFLPAPMRRPSGKVNNADELIELVGQIKAPCDLTLWDGKIVRIRVESVPPAPDIIAQPGELRDDTLIKKFVKKLLQDQRAFTLVIRVEPPNCLKWTISN